jgi:hypothetical protein
VGWVFAISFLFSFIFSLGKKGLLSNALCVAQFLRQEAHQWLGETQTILSTRPVLAPAIGYSFDRVIDYTLTLLQSCLSLIPACFGFSLKLTIYFRMIV